MAVWWLLFSAADTDVAHISAMASIALNKLLSELPKFYPSLDVRTALPVDNHCSSLVTQLNRGLMCALDDSKHCIKPYTSSTVSLFACSVYFTANWNFWILNKKHLKNVGPIRHCEPPHAHSPGVATGTVACRLRIDVHDANYNDNAWQRGPLWPHGMGPISMLIRPKRTWR